MIFSLAIVIALLQFTVLRDVNLLVVLAVFSGIRKGQLSGFLTGGAIGALASIFSPWSFLSNVMLYAITGFIAGAARSRMFYRETPFSEFLFSFAGVILFYGLVFVLKGAPQPSLFYTAIFSAAFSPLIFRVIER